MVSGSSPAGGRRRSALAARVPAGAAFGLLLLLALAGCSRAPGAAHAEEAPTPESPQEPVVTIAAAEDSVNADGPLQFLIHATPAPRADLTVGSTDSATVEVTDNDPPAPGVPVVTVKADHKHVCEGADAVWTLTATPAPASSLTVHFSLAYDGFFYGRQLSSTPRGGTVSITSSGTGTYRLATVDNELRGDRAYIFFTVDQGAGYVPGPIEGIYIGVRIVVVDNDTAGNARYCPTSAAVRGAYPPGGDY